MRVIFWFVWTITTLLSLIYVGTGLATFNNVAKVSVSNEFQSLKYGILGSCFLGFLMVLKFCVLSLCVNMTQSINPWHYNLRSEVGWGMMLGSALHMIFFMLLAGLALNSGDTWARGRFGSNSMEFQTLRVAYGFAYLLAICFFAMSLAIICSYRHFNHGHPMFMGGPQMATYGATVPMAAVADPRFVSPAAAYPTAAVMGPVGYPPAGYPHY